MVYKSFMWIIPLVATAAVNAQEYRLNSPDNSITVVIHTEKGISFQFFYENEEILARSKISMTTEEFGILGKDGVVSKTNSRSVNQTIEPLIKEKRAIIPDQFNELEIEFEKGYSIIFRAYQDGVAYRFTTNFSQALTVVDEKVHLEFSDPRHCYLGIPADDHDQGFISHEEFVYKPVSLRDFTSNHITILPALTVTNGDKKVVLTEADLQDYPGMSIRGNGKKSLIGVFPGKVKTQTFRKDRPRWDRNSFVIERENFIARTKGTRNFPWRVMVVANEDGELLDSQLVYKLSPKNRIEDPSWIRPGKVSWDWWNNWNIYGVDFKAGINTQTYKYYIDFAEAYGIEYILLDEGWYELGDLFDIASELDMEEITSYAKRKKVGIILWVVWKTLDDQLEEALDQFEQWGVQGLKIDFMQRADQDMVNWYYHIADEAAKRKLILDFHGAYKPSGLRRAYPNVLTREGVVGLEHNKWEGQNANPEMAVTLPFTRMVAGPMDYTPGAMLNANQDVYSASWARPMSLGTRCHQMAMYVVFESPLQMLADSPSNYYKEPECTAFITDVPTQWDETTILEAEIGNFVAIARRNGEDWFIGSLTGRNPNELSIDLSFLGPGAYEMTIFQDGVNADRYAGDYKKVVKKVTSESSIKIIMSPGGGWAAKLNRIFD